MSEYSSARILKGTTVFGVAFALITFAVLSIAIPYKLTEATSILPTIEFDQDDYYVPGEVATVTVNDLALAGNSFEDEIDVVVTSTTDDVGITLHIFESGDDVSDDGVFVANFDFVDLGGSSDSGILAVESGDTITADYEDGTATTATATAFFLWPFAIFDLELYHTDDLATLEFVHPPLSLMNDETTQTLTVTVKSDTDEVGFDVDLTESTAGSRSFSSDEIAFTTTGGSDSESLILHVTDGDRLEVVYLFDERSFSTGAFYGPEPTIELDSETYEFDDTATVTVNDLFVNYDEGLGSVFVDVTSDCDEGGIGLEIVETFVGSGEYVGTFDFTTDSEGGSSGSTLEVCGGEGGNINANYLSDATNEEAFDTAFVGPSAYSSIEITSATDAYWDVGVGVSGTTSDFGEDWSIEIDWGDGSPITEIPADSATWSIASEDGHAYSADDIGQTFDIVATLKFFDSIDTVEFTVAVSEPFQIEVLKRPTIIDPYFENEDNFIDEEEGEEESTDFRSALETKKFSVGGTLYDGITGEELGGKQIDYFGTGAAPLSSTITQGVIFEHPDNGGIFTTDCSNSPGNCSQDLPDIFGFDPDDSSNVVVHLKPNGKIIFPPNTLDVQIYLQDMGVGTFEWRVTEGNGEIQQNTAAAAGAGALIIPILGIASGSSLVEGSIVPNGLVEMEILSVDPDGEGGVGPDPDASIGIASLATHDITANAQYLVSFETEQIGVMDSPFEVHPGATFAIGTAPPVSVPDAPDLDKTIQLFFDGSSDPLYESSNSTEKGHIDILPDTSGLAGAIATGGAATTIIDDNGNDIVQYSCAVGNDDDADIVCDNWEGEGLSPGDSGIINVGGSTYVLCGNGAPEECDGIDDGIINTKDIYVEVDAQSGNMFTDAVFTSIKNVFSQAPTLNGKPFKLHLVKNESTIDAALFPTKIWKDTSSSWLNGLQVNTVTDGAAGDLSRQIKVKGLDVFTTGPVSSQKLTLTVRLTFSADPGTLGSFSVTNPAAFVSANLDTRGQLVSANTAAVNVAGISSPSSNVRIIPITITYSTTTVSGDGISDTSAQGRLGTTTITFNLGSGKTAVVLNTAVIGTGSQLITTNDDFDGIKRAYFGTSAERDLAQGSFGQERPNLVAKAQVYHYGLIVRSSGNTKIVCGNSGHSEIGGNDFLVSLGQKQTSLANTTPINCFTGPNGTDNEQIGTFLHELGHNFNWKHGGVDDDNCKPNYVSLMSYSRQIPVAAFGTWKATFSREALAALDERTSATGGLGISESAGIALSAAEWAANTAIDVVFGRSGTPVKYTIDNIGGANPISFDGDVPANENLFGFDINYLSSALGCNTANNKRIVGFDDWANIDLNFKDGKPIDGVYPITGQSSEHNDKTVKSLINAGNKGTFNGLLQPINQVYENNDFDGISQYKKGNTIPLKVSYSDLNNNPITNANLYVKVVKLNNGIPEDVFAESTVPLPADSGNKMRSSGGGQYIFNLATSNLQAPATYGVEIWLDAIGTGTKLDIDSDGYAGFFALKR